MYHSILHLYMHLPSIDISKAGVTLAAAGLVAAAAVTRRARRAKGSMPKGPVMVGASVAAEELLGSRPRWCLSSLAESA